MNSVDFSFLELLPEIKEDIEIIKKSLENSSKKKWLSVKELAEHLSYSKDRIYKLKSEVFRENEHFYKKGGKILFDRVAIDEWAIKGDNDETIHSQRQVVDRLLSSIKES
ncbi:MAG: helix-turn-helix domain-containing protein [Campylobacterales bacterium]